MSSGHRILLALLASAVCACTQPTQIKGMPTRTGTGTSPFSGGGLGGPYGADAQSHQPLTPLSTGTHTGLQTGTTTATGLQSGLQTGLPSGVQTGFTSSTLTGTTTSTGLGSGGGASPGGALAFTDVVQAVDQDCGGSSCHGQGAVNTVYADNQSNFDSQKSQIASQVQTGSMPPSGNLPDSDKQAILQYCSQ